MHPIMSIICLTHATKNTNETHCNITLPKPNETAIISTKHTRIVKFYTPNADGKDSNDKCPICFPD